MNKINIDATILVVDDIKTNLEVVKNYFKGQGYKLEFANSGMEALKTLDHTHIDLILLDIMMPEMDGFEVCKQIKNNPKTKDIPIIFLTAKTEIEDIVKGFSLGGVDYVIKPFLEKELLCRVRNHLELKFAREIFKRQAENLRDANKLILNTLYQFGQLFRNEEPEKE